MMEVDLPILYPYLYVHCVVRRSYAMLGRWPILVSSITIYQTMAMHARPLVASLHVLACNEKKTRTGIDRDAMCL